MAVRARKGTRFANKTACIFSSRTRKSKIKEIAIKRIQEIIPTRRLRVRAARKTKTHFTTNQKKNPKVRRSNNNTGLRLPILCSPCSSISRLRGVLSGCTSNCKEARFISQESTRVALYGENRCQDSRDVIDSDTGQFNCGATACLTKYFLFYLKQTLQQKTQSLETDN